MLTPRRHCCCHRCPIPHTLIHSFYQIYYFRSKIVIDTIRHRTFPLAEDVEANREHTLTHIQTRMHRKNSTIGLKPPSGTNSGVNRINPFFYLLFHHRFALPCHAFSIVAHETTAMKKIVNSCERC